MALGSGSKRAPQFEQLRGSASNGKGVAGEGELGASNSDAVIGVLRR